jgi:hypothetical protein
VADDDYARTSTDVRLLKLAKSVTHPLGDRWVGAQLSPGALGNFVSVLPVGALALRILPTRARSFGANKTELAARDHT